MDVTLAERRLQEAASECDVVAESIGLSGNAPMRSVNAPGQSRSKWLAIAAVAVVIAAVAGLLAVRGVGGSDGPSSVVRSGPGVPDAAPEWRVLDPASLPVKAGAFTVSIETEQDPQFSGSEAEGRWCVSLTSGSGGGASCGAGWNDRGRPLVMSSPLERGLLDPMSSLPDPPKGTWLYTVAAPKGATITIGEGSDALELDESQIAAMATATVDGKPWTATAFYIDFGADADDIHHPPVNAS